MLGRDVMGSYSNKVRELRLQLLDLISKGLELGSEYFNDELSSVQLLAINYYPPCPDPSLTLGLHKHSDVNLVTFLLQDKMRQGWTIVCRWASSQCTSGKYRPHAAGSSLHSTTFFRLLITVFLTKIFYHNYLSF